MNLKYLILLIAALVVSVARSQDRIYFKDGKVVKGKIMSIAENTLSYKDSVSADLIKTVPKKELVLAEYKNGSVFIFGNESEISKLQPNYNETRQQRKERKMKEWKDYESGLSDNVLGFYLPEIALGRLTVSYERFFFGKTIGVMVPASLTYNVFANTTNPDSATNAYNNRKGVNFITGLDVNFYTDLKPGLKYSVGPRFRYGTDMLLGGITGYTGQIQNGIFRSRGERFVNSLTIGFGFFKPTSNVANYNSNQVYPWGSINWRLGFRL